MTASMIPSSSLLSSSTDVYAKVSPIMLDELEKTDKLKNIAKIRSSIIRSVSFIKKSLVRTSSNLSQMSSLNGGSNHSIISFNDGHGSNHSMISFNHNGGSNRSIISFDETSVTKDHTSTVEDVFIDSLKALPSCMKGNRQKSNKDLVVRFQKSAKYNIYRVESYLEYAADLWYTTSNEKMSFLSPQLDTVCENIRAVQYMEAYVCARKQVYPKEWFEMKQPTTMLSSSNSNLLTSSYHDVVQGKQFGFTGFEQYSATLKKRRKVHIQSVIFMTCAVYYDCKNNYMNILHSNTKIQNKINPDGTLSYDIVSELVRKYSKSLTECDRYWATVMGQADYDATLEIYQEY